ncbi:MAG TPA: GGDEF domain-containing protein [Capillimicrobium sp.]|nr:GGDEF domain-containing protein [Capillimicrobium sp.]
MRQLRFRMLLVLCALAVGGAVWLGAAIQRDSATASAERMRALTTLRSSVLDQATASRNPAAGEAAIRARRAQERREYAAAIAVLREAAAGDADVARALSAVEEAETRWRERLDAMPIGPPPARPSAAAAARSQAMQALLETFNAAVDALDVELERLRRDDQEISALATVVLALLAVLVVGGAGMLLLHRRLRSEAAVAEAERRHRARQDELGQALLSAASEDEVHELLERHLEDPRRTVAVLESDPARNRLVTRTALDPRGPLAAALVDAVPRDCAAVRLGALHAERDGDDSLLRCELCGKAGRDRLCAPLVASGEVIGSVLAAQDEPLDDETRRRVAESVTIAAPVLANLRTIAIAESRAATDALTGLPNRRALDDTLKRMVAQALRRDAPLAVISIDLDHFKDVNDRFGHDKGDAVLAAVGAALSANTRASDVVGRWGGEEFLVLAPDTPLPGALALAETLRAAVARIAVVGVELPVTASMGVAICPDDATGPDLLLRQADRGLYAAKGLGRNRVERAPEAAPAAAPTPA